MNNTEEKIKNALYFCINFIFLEKLIKVENFWNKLIRSCINIIVDKITRGHQSLEGVESEPKEGRNTKNDR